MPIVRKPIRTPIRSPIIPQIRKPIRTPILPPVQSKGEQLSLFSKEFSAELYLSSLVNSKEYMIYLYGSNPSICQVRTHSSYEDKECADRAWIERKRAEELLGKKYYKKGINTDASGIKSDVWVRR